MIGHFGFSYIGLMYLLMLWIPNSIWVKNKPKDYDSSNENKLLLFIERIGQVVCTASILLFTDYNPETFDLWTIWFIVSFVLMIIYEVNWIRYFRSEQTINDFYRSIVGIPVPGASLPVVAFLLLGIYGKVIWLIISSVILGIGHIGIHLQYVRSIKNSKDRKKDL